MLTIFPRWTRVAGSAVLLASTLTACQTAKEAQASLNAKNGTGVASCPFKPNTSITAHVKIAYQLIPNADLIVKNKGLLEACMPKAHIQWLKFDSGGDVVQAFGSGSADMGLLGSSPATKALSAPLNIPMKIVWIHDVIGQAESLVARDKSISSLHDLKGKKIGVPFGSTSHYSLVLALKQAGMSTSDVNLINLSPDKILAAWQRKDIDAAWIWDPTLGQIKATGHVVTSSADTAKNGAATYDLGGARTGFVQSNAPFMKEWTAIENYAVNQIHTNPQASANSIAAELGIAPKDVLTQFKGYTYLPAPQQASATYFGGGLAKNIESAASFLQGQGDITKVSSNAVYEGGIYSTAIDGTK